MIQGIGPAFYATRAAVVGATPQVLRFAGVVATATGVSYCSWKFNKEVIDPMVERVTGKVADWLASRAEKRAYTDAAKYKRTIDREINRRIAAGELEPKTVHTGRSAARRRAEAAAEAAHEGEPATEHHDE